MGKTLSEPAEPRPENECRIRLFPPGNVGTE